MKKLRKEIISLTLSLAIILSLIPVVLNSNEKEKQSHKKKETTISENNQEELFFENFTPIYKDASLGYNKKLTKKIIKYEEKDCLYDNSDYEDIINKIMTKSMLFCIVNEEYENLFNDDSIKINNASADIKELYKNWSNKEDATYHDNFLFTNAVLLFFQYYQKYATNKTNEDIHLFSNLTIVSGNANKNNENNIGLYYPSQNVMVIDTDYIYKTLIDNPYLYNNEDINSYAFFEKYYQTLVKVIFHEFNHVRQNPCKCRNDKEKVTLNDLNLEFLKEASSESCLYNTPLYPFKDDEAYYSYTYTEYRRKEGLLLLLGLFNNTNINSYYNAIFDSDIKALYNFFGIQTSKDITKLNRIIYYISTIEGYDNPLDNTNTDIIDRELSIGSSYRTDLFLMTLERLISYADSHSDLTMEEEFLTYLIIRSYLINNSGKTEMEQEFIDGRSLRNFHRTFDEEYVNDIMKINDEFYIYLMDKYQLNIDELNDMEEEYMKIVYDITTNYLLDKTCENNDIRTKLITRFPVLESILNSGTIDINTFQYMTNFLIKDEKYEKVITKKLG